MVSGFVGFMERLCRRSVRWYKKPGEFNAEKRGPLNGNCDHIGAI